MAATTVNMNWLGGLNFNSVNLKRITGGSVGYGGKLISFSGDGDIFPTVVVNNMNDPHASFTTGDIGTLFGFVPGTTSTLLATLGDAKLATGGAINFSMINAVFETSEVSDSHAQYGVGNASWLAYSNDGLTNPLTFSRS